MRGISLFAALIISVIVLGAIVLLIYFLVYKSAINKTVTDQSNKVKHKKMPSPSSAAYIVLAAATAAVMIGVWLDIRSFTDNLSGLCSGLTQQVEALQARANYLESEMLSLADELKQEQSLFTSVDISWGTPDYSKHSVKLGVKVSPKNSTDKTEISLWFGDASIKLAKSGAGIYSGEIEADFYKRYDDFALITVTEEGQVRSEALDINGEDIREKYGAEMSERISCEYKYRSGSFSIKYWLKQVDEDFFDSGSFKLIVKSDGNVVFEDSVLPGDEKSCEMKKGTNADIYISAVDRSGNTHICSIFSGIFTEDEEGYLDVFDRERVLDSEGNLIVKY